MTRQGHQISLPREQLVHLLALGALLVMGGLVIAGPGGLLSWRENLELLERREAHIAALSEQRDVLRNRIDLLHPDHADPDLTGELLRQNLNVVHPDEVVLPLEPAPQP
ncbi:MAG: septum formation initiator [Erythrobacter sp. 34-65-8]|nr:MAG: septum formation initiator [Erythrobacter sp. 34-65-8]